MALATKSRGLLIARILDVFSVLLDGCEHRIYEFDYLGLSSKTVRRILDEFVKTSLVVKRHYEQRGSSYRLVYLPRLQKPDYRTQFCSGCNKRKPVCEFNRNKSAVSGYRPYCRECDHAYAKQWYAANAERVRPIKRETTRRIRARQKMD